MQHVPTEAKTLALRMTYDPETQLKRLTRFATSRRTQAIRMARGEAISHMRDTYQTVDGAISELIRDQALTMESMNRMYEIVDAELEPVRMMFQIPEDEWERIRRPPPYRMSRGRRNNAGNSK